MQKISLFEDEDAKQVLINFLIGGGVAGGTLASGIGLYKMLKGLNAEKLPVEPNGEVKSAGIGGSEVALSILGGLGTGYIGYKGIEQLLQLREKAELERRVADAQKAYYNNLKALHTPEELEKIAGGMSTGATAGAIGYLLLLALGTAGGVGAYQSLKKYFPQKSTDAIIKDDIKKYSPTTASKVDYDTVVVNRDDTYNSSLEDDTTIPDYSQDTSQRVIQASADIQSEYLLNIVLADEKRANCSGLGDVSDAICAGKCDEMLEGCDSVDQIFDKAKVLSDGVPAELKSPERKQISITIMSTHPTLSRAIEPVVASEFADMAPMMFSVGKNSPCDTFKVANELMTHVVMGTRKVNLEKVAALYAEDISGATKLASNIDYETASSRLSTCLISMLKI
jgi:hypothetical protein